MARFIGNSPRRDLAIKLHPERRSFNAADR
jgi:hypothetical protein